MGLPPRPMSRTPITFAVLIALLAVVVQHLELSLGGLAEPGSRLREFVGRFLEPDWRSLRSDWALMRYTLGMAVWGTAGATLIAVVLAPLAAANLSPHRPVCRAARLLSTLLRCLPDPLLTMLFAASLGSRNPALAGIVALGLHTGGFLAKVVAESLERLDPGVLDAVRSTGAGGLQVLMFAGWPGVLREAAGHTLYVLDRNVRMACVVGVFGAGGVGFELFTRLNTFEHGRAASLLLMIVATVLIVDVASGRVRRWLA